MSLYRGGARFVVFALILLLCNCKRNTSNTTFLNIGHVVRGHKLEFEVKKYQTAVGHGYRIFRLKYYVSNFVLERGDGSIYLVDKVQYCDARDPETCRFNLGSIPPGTYNKLSFIFGLDETKNVEGGLENNVVNGNMEWPVPGEKGYHYMKLEGKYDSLNMNVERNFSLHTGAISNNQNFVRIELELPQLSLGTNDHNINVAMDIDEWLHHPNDYDFGEFGQGIMSSQTAQEKLRQNGSDVFRLVSTKKI
ncbi:MAG: hypothetical protein OEQ53_17300 [Saprospiraceae bacterium]|nr:hypothetical protein [Saprospiraceae bacterium]